MSISLSVIRTAAFAATLATAATLSAAAANPLPLFSISFQPPPSPRFQPAPQGPIEAIEEADADFQVPAHLKRQIVAYTTREAPGTVVIDTPHTYLYLVLGNGRAIRYGIGVGRDGFTWSGVKTINKKAEWPDWTPPEEMLVRQPYLPRFMAGGPGNPLGARAMYLGGTVYRIHGTNAPNTIGQQVSSGCIRMRNEDIIDLYGRVKIGTRVVVI